MINIQTTILDLLILGAVNTILTGYLTLKLPVASFLGISVKQLLSWFIAILVVFLAQLPLIHLVAPSSLLWTLAGGIGVGLLSNGIFSMTIVQSLLTFLKANNANSGNAG